MFEINFGKSRIRHKTTLNLNLQTILSQFQRRYLSDPTLSDMELKNKMDWVWTTLNLLITNFIRILWSVNRII